MVTSVAHPPETLEGWYALHQIYTCETGGADHDDTLEAVALPPSADGWSATVRLIGSVADVMVMHFRPTLDAIGEAQEGFRELASARGMTLVYSFLSVTEAGLYHLTAKAAQEAESRGGAVGDEQYTKLLAEKVAAERDSEHVRKRLYPPFPASMPWVCFYPMSKRRDAGQNWYTLPLGERSLLMHAHGTTGRRYAGRVQQIITGAIGFENWEWGVTLFAKDPIDIKKLVTDMRFDEVSAKYADFGDFFIGRVAGNQDGRKT